MADPNKKRITVYLDLNIESDKLIWEFLEGKRKTEIIRNVLSNYVNGVPSVKIEQNDKDTNETNITAEELEDLSDFIK